MSIFVSPTNVYNSVTFTPGCITLWKLNVPSTLSLGFPGSSAGKESACSAVDLGSIPGLRGPSGEGNSYPLQNSDLENLIDCIVHGVAKSWTWLSHFHFRPYPYPTNLWFVITSEVFIFWDSSSAQSSLTRWFSVTSMFPFSVSFSSLFQCIVNTVDEHYLAVHSASSGCEGLSRGEAYRGSLCNNCK